MTSENETKVELKGEDISPNKDGGVLKEIIKEGHGDEFPSTGDKVTVHYVGTLLDGSQFDSSRDRNDKFQFDLGKGAVIKAWDIGVATMKLGEICRLTCKPEYAYGKQGSGDKIPPDSTLIFEIELFDFQGEDISEDKDQSIIKRTLKKGDGWAKPNSGAGVEVNLKGTHEGKVFDERSSVHFAIDEGFLHDVPPGVEHAITKMAKGETCKLKMKSKAAWPDKSAAEKYNLPPNAAVEYEVTLVNFDKAKESWSYTDAEKLEQSDVLKKRAGELFKDGHYKVALKKYTTIDDYLKSVNFPDEPSNERCREHKLAAASNIALCHLKLSEYVECVKACDKALEIDANHEKSLFRRASSYQTMGDYAEAIRDYQAVLKVNPSNTTATKGIQACREAIKAKNESDKKLFAKMFAPSKHQAPVSSSSSSPGQSDQTLSPDVKTTTTGEQHQNGSGEQTETSSSVATKTNEQAAAEVPAS